MRLQVVRKVDRSISSAMRLRVTSLCIKCRTQRLIRDETSCLMRGYCTVAHHRGDGGSHAIHHAASHQRGECVNGDDSLEPYFCGLSRWIISGQCPSSPLTFKAGHCKLGPVPVRGWGQCGRTTWGPAPMQARANSSPVPTQGHFQLTASAPRGSAFGLTEVQALELCDVRTAEPDTNGIVGHAQ